MADTCSTYNPPSASARRKEFVQCIGSHEHGRAAGAVKQPRQPPPPTYRKDGFMKRLTRRTFVGAAGAGLLATRSMLGGAPQVLTRRAVKPLAIASSNGNKLKDAAALTCVAKAFSMIASGADPLDAVIAGVNIVELDPE